ncbi:MAG: DUF1559 domain-containing protein [Planctomycetota bacterium]
MLPPTSSPPLRVHRPSGFTLIEMMIVIAIIAVLICLLLPAVQQVRESARRTQCKNNLMQIGIALQNYESAHRVLPPGTQNVTGPIVSKEDETDFHMGWITQILPFMELTNDYNHIDFTSSVYSQANRPVRARFLACLICPSDPSTLPPGVGVTNYCGIHNDYETPIDVNQNGVLFLNSSVRCEQITDGLSNTVFVVESPINQGGELGWMSGTKSSLRNGVVWKNRGQLDANGNPAPPEYQSWINRLFNSPPRVVSVSNAGTNQVGGPGSYHTGGAQFLLGDSSVRFLSENIDPATLRTLMHRADGEMMGDF